MSLQPVLFRIIKRQIVHEVFFILHTKNYEMFSELLLCCLFIVLAVGVI